jgi:hypothetical protein
LYRFLSQGRSAYLAWEQEHSHLGSGVAANTTAQCNAR